ncbi:MSHA pilin protein MshD [Gammaproteobacteria bacterium]
MSNRHTSGFTLVEMILSIVIIGIGLAGVLTVFDTTVRSSADPMIRKQMLAIAEEMMEEILLKPYAITPGAISGCDRSSADDIRDYNGYNHSICDIDGTPVAGLTGYSVRVVVGSETWQGIANTLRITVTVTHGSESIQLVSWRTDYA